jgi:aspartyl/glutamyl-tRNA(Asn/Gln) amidotransferase C subunit
MSLTTENITALAELAKIEITDVEREQYLNDINGILGHVSMIAGLDTANFENTYHFHTVARSDDGATWEFDQGVLMQNVPNKSEEGYVEIHKVINK